jgi:hypothetical protein
MSPQLHDVSVLQHAHVFHLSLHSSLCARGVDDLLGKVFHGNLLTSKDMGRHWAATLYKHPIAINGGTHS